jgi:lysophospholipase L1-like esterase
VDGQLRELSSNVDTINTVINNLGGLYARTRTEIILKQIRSQDDKLLIVFGDSIVEQMYFPMTSGLNVLNAGISGTRALEAKPFLQDVLAASHGPLIVLSIGSNDAFGKKVSTPQEFAAGYEDLVRTVLASGRKLVLVTVPPLENDKPGAEHFDGTSLVAYNEHIREIGRRLGVVVADVNDVLARRRAAHPGSFTVDGVHLDAAAAGVWRDTVYAAIRQALAG